MPAPRSNESLADRLVKAEVYDEFCTLMFGQRTRYEDLLEQLEKWSVSSSLGGLHRFSESHRSSWTLERARRMAAQELDNEELDEAQRKVVAERLFNLAASPDITDKALLKMRDQEIKVAIVRQNDEKLKQNERRLAQQDDLIDMQKRKIAAQEAEIEELERRRREAEDAVNKAAENGGMSDETIKAVRAALRMSPDES